MAKGKILIVDDEPLTCQIVSKILKLNGYETTILTDSRQIIEHTLTENPDLILLDYHLGVEFGLDVLNALKKKPATAAIPVVVTSGIDHRTQVMQAGAEGFLQKPFNWDELVDALETLLPGGDSAPADARTAHAEH